MNGQESVDIVLGSINTFMKYAKVIKVKEGLEADESKFDAVGAEKSRPKADTRFIPSK